MMFGNLKDHHLLALYRGGWRRCKAFFRHPRDIIALRQEIERRGLHRTNT